MVSGRDRAPGLAALLSHASSAAKGRGLPDRPVPVWVHHPRRLDDRVAAVPLDDEIGGSVDVQFRDHVHRLEIDFIAQ